MSSSENVRLSQENDMLRLQCLQAAQAAAASQHAALVAQYYGAGYPSFPMMPWPGVASFPSQPHPLQPYPQQQYQQQRRPKKKTGPARGRADTVDEGRTRLSSAPQPRRPRAFSEACPKRDGADPEVSGTTVMLRNLPTSYTRSALLEMVDELGFGGVYDFLYLPVDFKSGACLGYAFVNLVDHVQAVRFQETLEGFDGWKEPSPKVCTVNWSSPFQGLEVHIERFRNSPIMHESVPDEHKPILFKDGARLPFPEATKTIRAPRLRAGRNPTAETDAKVEVAVVEAARES